MSDASTARALGGPSFLGPALVQMPLQSALVIVEPTTQRSRVNFLLFQVYGARPPVHRDGNRTRMAEIIDAAAAHKAIETTALMGLFSQA